MFDFFKKKNMVEFELDVRNAFEEAFEVKSPKNLYYDQLADHYAANIPFVNQYFSGSQSRDVYVALFKYFFMKAFEGKVASYIYKDNPKRNKEAFDLYYSADEILEPTYRTNLPAHIEAKVITYSAKAHKYGVLIVDKFIKPGVKFNSTQLLILTQCIASAFAVKEIEKNNLVTTIAGVDNSMLLTMNEVRKIAGDNFYNMLLSLGYDVKAYSNLIDVYDNFIVEKNGQRYSILFDAQVYPVDTHFFGSQLKGLYKAARDDESIPCVAGINLGSKNSDHFNAGIIVKDDIYMIKYEGVSKLEIRKNPKTKKSDWFFKNIDF